jgi:hypothetical protein
MIKLNVFLFILFSLVYSQVTFAIGIDSDSTGNKDIEFVSMEATLSSKIIHFKWDVEKEVKGDYFLIEKSTDKQNWKRVTQVTSLGNHKERHTYEVSEINFAEGANEYFRIKRVDNMGNESILDMVNISHPVLTNLMLVPIEANKLMSISYDSKISSTARITVMNSEGEIAFEENQMVTEGYNRLELNIKSFKEGVYFVLIKDDFENKLSKRLTIYGKRGKRK